MDSEFVPLLESSPLAGPTFVRPLAPRLRNHITTSLLVFIGILVSVAGCGQTDGSASGSGAAQSESVFSQPAYARNNQEVSQADIEDADVSVLFIGNSHAAPIPQWMREIFATEHPDEKVLFIAARGYGFLDDHARRPTTLAMIEKGQWDYVVLQAQKYSSSGKYHYSYDGAIKLANLATENGSKVVMYPEWPRRGHPDEYQRISKIHHEIADQTKAIVAPIGEGWEHVANDAPEIGLYASDGNHASAVGSYLNACIFYGIIKQKTVATGYSPKGKKTGRAADLESQKKAIHQAAWAAVEEMKMNEVPESPNKERQEKENQLP